VVVTGGVGCRTARFELALVDLDRWKQHTCSLRPCSAGTWYRWKTIHRPESVDLGELFGGDPITTHAVPRLGSVLVKHGDLRRHPRSKEDCVAACYDCLMSYTNQSDHRLLDRLLVRDLLLDLASAHVDVSSTSLSRAEQLRELERQAGSELERTWLRFLDGRGLRLPSRAQVYLEDLRTRPDFVYDEDLTVIYIDGPPHKYSERQARDRAQSEALEDAGYTVVRFADDADWEAIVRAKPSIFGVKP